MTAQEDQLRRDLEDIATLAPDVVEVRARIATPAAQGRARRVHHRGLVLAGASLLVAGGAFFVVHNPGDRAETRQVQTTPSPGGSEGVPDEEKQQAVSAFIRDVRNQWGAKVYLGTDWDSQTIRVAVAPPVPSDLESLNGRVVAGLTVVVFSARTTVADLNAFIRAVHDNEFPQKHRVCSFNLPLDSTSIEVRIAHLSEMSEDDVAALRSNLERLTNSPIVFSEEPPIDPPSQYC